MERNAREADELCLTQLHTLFEDVLPASLASSKAAGGTNSRRSIYTPLITAGFKGAPLMAIVYDTADVTG